MINSPKNVKYVQYPPHADGKSGEVSQSTKHFWGFTTKRCNKNVKTVAVYDLKPACL